jgi:ADP-ribosylglycohydrolase
MMGAIIGDIVGSVYEWHNIKTKDFPLFRDDCSFTDDTVMTVAVAEGLMNGGERDDLIDAMKKYGRMYPDAGYGGRFGGWLFSDSREPYNSFGNGSAMRVSPCGWAVEPIWDVTQAFAAAEAYAERSAVVTHNHPEGIKGAKAVAYGILYMRYARQDKTDMAEQKAKLREAMEARYGYDLSRTLDQIRPTYRFNETCQETVPQAIIAFLESTDFEDAIRNAISLGGDSDTLAAITGSIAEAAYGIPQWIIDKAWTYLDEPLRDVCRRWHKKVKQETL